MNKTRPDAKGFCLRETNFTPSRAVVIFFVIITYVWRFFKNNVE